MTLITSYWSFNFFIKVFADFTLTNNHFYLLLDRQAEVN